jgi:capsular polysaccharide biosynthesis protein
MYKSFNALVPYVNLSVIFKNKMPFYLLTILFYQNVQAVKFYVMIPIYTNSFDLYA